MRGRLAQLLAPMVCVLAVAASSTPALAQDSTPTPSAEELWKDYPLDQGDAARAPSSAPTTAAANRSAATDGTDSNIAVIAILAIVAAGAAAAAGFVVMRRSAREPAVAAPGPGIAAPRARSNGLLFMSATGGPRRSRASGPPRQGVPPPDATRSWTAEIQWREFADEYRFCVIARGREAGGETVIARSEPLDWPPDDADAVQALVGAADALTEALVTAGWRPLAPGTAWFEKRFEWLPAPAPSGWAPPRAPQVAPGAPPPSGRFRPAAAPPEDAERLWRSEMRWSAGYIRSRFEVVM
jgi:hypothetical protein